MNLALKETYQYRPNFNQGTPLNRALAKNSAVSFGGNGPAQYIEYAIKENQPIVFMRSVKHILNLPCAYCGKPMISDGLKEQIAFAARNLKGSPLVQFLTGAKPYMREGMEDAVEKMKTAASQNETKSIHEIVSNFSVPVMEKIVSTQFSVLKSLEEKYAKFCTTPEEKTLFEDCIKTTRAYIKKQIKDKDEPFTNSKIRVAFLRAFPDSIFERMTEKEKAQFASETAKLALPINLSDLYFVRNRSNMSVQALVKLFDPARITVDHVKPQTLGGETVLGNLLPVCLGCNRAKTDTSFVEYLEQNPSVASNIRKQLNYMKKFLNVDISAYISSLSEHLSAETGGKLDLKDLIK